MNMHKNTRLTPHHHQAIWTAYTQEKRERYFPCPPLHGQPPHHLLHTQSRARQAARAAKQYQQPLQAGVLRNAALSQSGTRHPRETQKAG